MWSYYELLTDFAEPVIVRVREEVRTGFLHPMDAKMRLAHIIIAGFHGEEAAKKAFDEFQRVFRERQAPEEILEYQIRRVSPQLFFLHRKHGATKSSTANPFPLAEKEKWTKLLALLNEVSSKSEADRLFKQGAVEINETTVTDVNSEIPLNAPGTFMVRVGKRKFFRLVVG
jgi:tyrosyl-tRNA synthetase